MSKDKSEKLSRRHFMGSCIAATGGLLLSPYAQAKHDSGNSCGKHPTPRPHPGARTYIEGNMRIFESNGVPDHPIGCFPSPTDPYAVGSRLFRVGVPLRPKKNPRGSMPIGLWRFGVALNGIPFDPAGPELVKDWRFEVLSYTASKYLGIDCNDAHVQPYDGPGQELAKTGQYHYHGFPTGLYANIFRQAREYGVHNKMFLLGYAADGFPIYAPGAPSDPSNPASMERTMRPSYRLKKGSRRAEDSRSPLGEYDGTFVEDYEYVKGLGDLDECNGREGVTPEYPEGIYHYFITLEFPFVPRRFRGLPVDKNFHHPVEPGPGQVPRELAEYPH